MQYLLGYEIGLHKVLYTNCIALYHNDVFYKNIFEIVILFEMFIPSARLLPFFPLTDWKPCSMYCIFFYFSEN